MKKLLLALLLVSGAAVAGLNQVAGPVYGNQAGTAANAGFVGEANTTSASGVSIPTSGTPANIVSQSFAPGDWDVQCAIQYSPASTTTVSFFTTGTSSTSGAMGSYEYSQTYYLAGIAGSSFGAYNTVSPRHIYRLTTTTTLYCEANAVFGTSTMSANGTMIWRRMQ